MRLFSHACKCLNSYIKLGYSEIEHNINTYKSLSGTFPLFIPFSRLSPLQAKQSWSRSQMINREAGEANLKRDQFKPKSMCKVYTLCSHIQYICWTGVEGQLKKEKEKKQNRDSLYRPTSPPESNHAEATSTKQEASYQVNNNMVTRIPSKEKYGNNCGCLE